MPLNSYPVARSFSLFTLVNFVVLSSKKTIEVNADIQRIWKAMVDPADVVQWSYDVSEIMSDPQDYPTANKTYRWRFRHPFLKLTLYDTPTTIIPTKTYHSVGQLLFFTWDETYELEAQSSKVLLSVELNLQTKLPIIGKFIDRFFMKWVVKEQVQQTLNRLAKFCER